MTARGFGSGYFNPKSLIAVRLVSRENGARIDATFFSERLARALALREALYAKPFYRLVHAEGDGLPGLTIDRFGDVLVVQVTTAGMEELLVPLKMALESLLSPKTIILRADAPSRALEGLESYVRAEKGEGGRMALEENGVRYFAELGQGQKTGWYYDQRENRAFMAALAKGKTVLDAYSYTGGFGIAAAKAGAAEVMCVDSSDTALKLAEDSAAGNAVSIKPIKSDVFEELERLSAQKEKFDIVIADPPPFVKAKKDLEPGAKALSQAGAPGRRCHRAERISAVGVLLAQYAHRPFRGGMRRGHSAGGRRATLIRSAGAGPDHPVHPMLPESAYLKALVYALD